jgi:4-oxalmesaconate hydratase
MPTGFPGNETMIIDCHGHFTTTPPQVADFRARQIAEFQRSGRVLDDPPLVSDEEIRSGIEPQQRRLMRERGVDLTIFSPRAMGMDHHNGNEDTNVVWARYCNELVHRVCKDIPGGLRRRLPAAAGPRRRAGRRVFDELERCVRDFGFIGLNLEPGSQRRALERSALWDRDWWYPLYERMVELDVPAMIHVSGSCICRMGGGRLRGDGAYPAAAGDAGGAWVRRMRSR